jgi:hypothetical protein
MGLALAQAVHEAYRVLTSRTERAAYILRHQDKLRAHWDVKGAVTLATVLPDDPNQAPTRVSADVVLQTASHKQGKVARLIFKHKLTDSPALEPPMKLARHDGRLEPRHTGLKGSEPTAHTEGEPPAMQSTRRGVDSNAAIIVEGSSADASSESEDEQVTGGKCPVSSMSGSGEEDQVPYEALIAVGLEPDAEIQLQQRLRQFLQKFLFRNPGVGRGAILGQYAKDPEPKRIVIFTFSERGAIMRRVLPGDIHGNDITIKTDDRYVDIRGTGVKQSDVIYFPQYAARSRTDEGEREMVFETLRHLQFTEGWGYEDASHMKKHPTLRGQLMDVLERELNNNYSDFRPFDKTHVPTASIQAYVREVHETFRRHLNRMGDHYQDLQGSTGRRNARSAASGFFEESQRLCDAILREMGNIRERRAAMVQGKLPAHVPAGYQPTPEPVGDEAPSTGEQGAAAVQYPARERGEGPIPGVGKRAIGQH